MEVMRKYWDAPPRHLFCLMADFVSLKHRARLLDAEEAGFSIDPAEPTLRPLPPPPPPKPAVPWTLPPVKETPPQRKPELHAWDLEREQNVYRPVEPPPSISPLMWIFPVLAACCIVGLTWSLLPYFFPKKPVYFWEEPGKSKPPPAKRPWRARTILRKNVQPGRIGIP